MRPFQDLLLAGIFAAASINANAQTLSDPNLTVTSLRTGGLTLSKPTCLLMLGQDDMLIGEKETGKVKRMTNGIVSSTIALDLTVNYYWERGLESMTRDPSFETNHYVYIFFVPSSTDLDTNITSEIGPNSILTRFTWNPDNGLLEDRSDILTDLPNRPAALHNSGVVAFGPPSARPDTKKLFCVIGDTRNSAGDSPNKAENFSNGGAPDGGGNIIRINRDGTIPTDNPFYNVEGANTFIKRMYAFGYRNSFGMEFDPFSGRLWTTENGANKYDEINMVEVGFNSGWRNVMGPLALGDAEGADPPAGNFVTFGGLGTYSDPEFSFYAPVGITSIHFFTGNRLGPEYVGDCFVGDVNYKHIYRFKMNETRTGFTFTTPELQDLVDQHPAGESSPDEIIFGSIPGGITSIQTGPDGKMYVLSFGYDVANLGKVFRIENPLITETPGPSPTPSPSPTESPSPTASLTPTESPSPTQSPTPSPTESPTPSPSATESPTPSPSPTQSLTPSPTATPLPISSLWSTH